MLEFCLSDVCYVDMQREYQFILRRACWFGVKFVDIFIQRMVEEVFLLQ